MDKREYTAILHAPAVRRRTILGLIEGQVSSFCVQLELNHAPASGAPDDWRYIARFDHNPQNTDGHDITEEGLHMDIRHPSEEDRTYRNFPPVPLGRAPGYAEDHFDGHYLEICDRYFDWSSEADPAWTAILPIPL